MSNATKNKMFDLLVFGGAASQFTSCYDLIKALAVLDSAIIANEVIDLITVNYFTVHNCLNDDNSKHRTV
jgi:beta-glucosidase/6-phospho-beta-glucosidase/beta-galactosidase